MKTTKKIFSLILVFTLLTFTSCKSDDDPNSSSDKSLNTPEWIRGTWLKPNGMNGQDGFKFTADDSIALMYDQNGNLIGNGVSLMESIQNRDYTITETKTDTSYQFVIHYNDTNSSETWTFNKMANNQMEYVDIMNSSFIYTKVE